LVNNFMWPKQETAKIKSWLQGKMRL